MRLRPRVRQHGLRPLLQAQASHPTGANCRHLRSQDCREQLVACAQWLARRRLSQSDWSMLPPRQVMLPPAKSARRRTSAGRARLARCPRQQMMPGTAGRHRLPPARQRETPHRIRRWPVHRVPKAARHRPLRSARFRACWQRLAPGLRRQRVPARQDVPSLRQRRPLPGQVSALRQRQVRARLPAPERRQAQEQLPESAPVRVRVLIRKQAQARESTQTPARQSGREQRPQQQAERLAQPPRQAPMPPASPRPARSQSYPAAPWRHPIRH